MTMKKMSEWDLLRDNPPRNWRDKWESRVSLRRFDTMLSARGWALRHESDYNHHLKIDLHVKDGFVVYYDRGVVKNENS